jgi:hypothetical protein
MEVCAVLGLDSSTLQPLERALRPSLSHPLHRPARLSAARQRASACARSARANSARVWAYVHLCAARASHRPDAQRTRAPQRRAGVALVAPSRSHGWCVCKALQLLLCALAAQASSLGAPAHAQSDAARVMQVARQLPADTSRRRAQRWPGARARAHAATAFTRVAGWHSLPGPPDPPNTPRSSPATPLCVHDGRGREVSAACPASLIRCTLRGWRSTSSFEPAGHPAAGRGHLLHGQRHPRGRNERGRRVARGLLPDRHLGRC